MTEINPEPLTFDTEIVQLHTFNDFNFAEVSVKGTTRFCRVPADTFSVAEQVIYVRPDVDVTFPEQKPGVPEKFGIFVGKQARKLYITGYGKIGDYKLDGSVLKREVKGEPWVKIRKHVSSTPLAGGDFPEQLVQKTNELNAENTPEVMTKLLGQQVDYTLKLDGQSITLIYQPDVRVTVCSRNQILKETEPVYKWMMERFPKTLDIFPLAGIAEDHQVLSIQGELIGERINGNMHEITSDEFYIFNVEEGKQRLNRHKMEQRLPLVFPSYPPKDVHMVNLLKVETLPEGNNEALKVMESYGAEQRYTCGNLAEGIVVRHHQDYTISLKVVTAEYGDEKTRVQARLKKEKQEKREKEKNEKKERMLKLKKERDAAREHV